MDTAGNNRYQLLFMDEDAVPTSQPEKAAKKKTVNTAVENSAAKKNMPAKKKESSNNEKENKANVMNERIAKKPNASAGNRANKAATNDGKSTQSKGDGNRSIGSKFQGSEMREERNFKRNFGERVGGGSGNEYGNQKTDRQFNNRDNRESRPNPRFRSGGDRFGKREFDRQSGSDKTGIKAVDKRDGAGAHNWGSLKQEIEDIDKVTNDIDVNGTDKDESANEQQATEQTVAPEEDVKEMTLDEWKALRQNRSKPQYNLRKAGEGEDATQWKKMVVLNKKKENDSEEEFEFDPSLYPQRVGRLQRITDIQFNFNDGRRGFGRGRGGAGGGPGRERGARFENRNQERQPRNVGERQQRKGGPSSLKVDDEHQFPTLG